MRNSSGILSGLIGVVIFSGSLPATKLAVASFSAAELTCLRAAIAGAIAAIILVWGGDQLPTKKHLRPICIIAFGAVWGFPFLTGFALTKVSTVHSLVFIGLMPLATALFARVKEREEVSGLFWFFATLGSAFVASYALYRGGALFSLADFYLLSAVCICGLSYAEGAVLTRSIGGWRAIAWPLVFSLPASIPLCIVFMPSSLDHITPLAAMGLAYVSVFSMIIGFVFWYRGLAAGGAATVGQLQLFQPFLGLLLCTVILNEPFDALAIVAATGVIACVFFAKKSAATALSQGT